MPWRINKIEPCIFPFEMRHATFNRDATFLFFGHVVHRGKAIFHAPRAVNLARRKKDSLRKCRLARINVGQNGNISNRLFHKPKDTFLPVHEREFQRILVESICPSFVACRFAIKVIQNRPDSRHTATLFQDVHHKQANHAK